MEKNEDHQQGQDDGPDPYGYCFSAAKGSPPPQAKEDDCLEQPEGMPGTFMPPPSPEHVAEAKRLREAKETSMDVLGPIIHDCCCWRCLLRAVIIAIVAGAAGGAAAFFTLSCILTAVFGQH